MREIALRTASVLLKSHHLCRHVYTHIVYIGLLLVGNHIEAEDQETKGCFIRKEIFVP